MYDMNPVPFFSSFYDPRELGREQILEEDMRKMKSFYPDAAARIQEKVDTLCDRMEYDGSFLYDEYPDHFMMSRMCRHICDQMEREEELQEQALPSKALQELVEVLFYNEMYHRRCRRHRCRRYF